MPTGLRVLFSRVRSSGRAALLLLAMLAVLVGGVGGGVGCGGSRGGSKGGPAGDSWGVTSRIPADTPYVFAALTPVPDALVAKFTSTFDAQLAQAHRTLLPLLASTSAPWAKAISMMLEELRTQKPTQWWQNAGFAPGGRFAIYGLSLWPVARLEVAKPEVVVQTVQRYLDLAQIQVAPSKNKDWTFWPIHFADKVILIGVGKTEAVAAFMPAAQLPAAMPWITGEKKPERSLADDRALAQLMAQHNFLPYMVGFADLQATIAILSGRATGAAREFSASLSLPELASCTADVDRLAALMPRFSFGYTKLNEQGFSGGLVLEMPPHVVNELSRVAVTAPGLPWPATGKPLFAMEVSADVGNALQLFGDIGKAIAAKPFGCGALAGLNDMGKELSQLAQSPMPPIVTGLRGVSVVVDEATTNPTSIIGYVTAVGEQLETVQTWLMMFPGFGDLKLATDGTPASLPLGKLGVDFAKSAHLAVQGDRLTVAVGGDSARRTAEQIKAVPGKVAPLFGMSFDAEKVAKLSPEAAAAFEGYQTMRDVSFAVELRPQGLYMNVDGSW